MSTKPHSLKKQRITVKHWTEKQIFGDGFVVNNPDLIPTSYLYQGVQLNLLLSERQADGSLTPQHLVLNPDYLIDVTTICRCFTHYGDSPATYLLGKFMPSPASAAILLGNAANQFLDDCVNSDNGTSDDVLYRKSLRKTFLGDPLRFATTDGIDKHFSEQCHEQFTHIRQTVREHLPQQVTLESAFLCEALGIQGRIDLITNDHQTIWELKSGKAEYDESYRYEHAMQMALYKESLYYNEGLPYAQVSTLLFYSRYPHLMDIRLGRKDIHRAVAVRNAIVHLEHLLEHHPESLLNSLTEQHFNTLHIHDRFYESYLRPRIVQFLSGLQTNDLLSKAYFYRMLAFVQREQVLAKTGVEGVNLPPGHLGFADTWRADESVKRDAGRIIPDLRLTPILDEDGIVALDAVTDAIDESSNFRVGDMVMLYPQEATSIGSRNESSAASRTPAFEEGCRWTYTSCIIERLTATSLRLRLRYPQHDAFYFDNDQVLFAIEPAHADSSYTVLYRGLYAFLRLPEERQQLFLGQRIPQFDKTKTLKNAIEDEALKDIILRAKQARDYFLLVGPPGTGKTTIALQLMVKEFLAENNAAGVTAPPRNTPLMLPDKQSTACQALLLMAYTNRAIDEICSMLHGIGAPYLRLGPELSCAREHRHHLITRQAAEQPTRNSIRQLLLTTPIIVGTISSISSLPELFHLKHFATAIIDEASQVLEPHLLPLFCAKGTTGAPAIDKFIFIGDHKQLPAVVVQSPEESAVADSSLRAIGLTNCRRSLFERLHETALLQGATEAIGLLHRQGRMHEEILSFVNQHYYDGTLALIPLPHQTGPLPYSSLGRHRLRAIHVEAPPESCSAKSNHTEAARVALLVKAFTDEFTTSQASSLNKDWPGNDKPALSLDWHHRLGIIVPFRGQITLIRRALAAQHIPEYEHITIDTVERFQGSQRDIIIFSTVVSAPWQLAILSQPVLVDGQLLDRKLNVALTRARQQFILVGNCHLLRTCPPYRMFIEAQEEAKSV